MNKQRNEVEARIGNFLKPGKAVGAAESVSEPIPETVVEERRAVRVVNRVERIPQQPPSTIYQRTNVLVRPEYYRKLKKQAVEMEVPMYELMDRAFGKFLKE
jgi:hypothetical protein